MRILVISDEESKFLWDYFEKSKLDGIDMIISCGDLAPQYLSFLATFTHAPVFYVPGNHDECYNTTPPDGCICIDEKIVTYQGVRIMGLGGSMRYRPGEHQYTESQMAARIRKMRLKIALKGGVDIVVAHSPIFEHNDAPDLPHRGFKCFQNLLHKYRPAYFLHGHVHANYGGKFARESKYEDTIVINGYDRYVFDYHNRDVI